MHLSDGMSGYFCACMYKPIAQHLGCSNKSHHFVMTLRDGLVNLGAAFDMHLSFHCLPPLLNSGMSWENIPFSQSI